jgi:reactive intermediate/imine deaminase
MKNIIATPNAPQPIGPYSQAVQQGQTIYLSGQIALNPKTMEMAVNDIEVQVQQVLDNLSAVVKAAGGHLSDIVKLTIFLTNLSRIGVVNAHIEKYFSQPYPARTTIEVKALPKAALVEIDAIMVLS